MSRRFVTAALLALLALGVTAPGARAQAGSGSTSAAASSAPASPGEAAPAASAKAPPSHPATGYGYSDHKPRRRPAGAGLVVRSGPRPHPAAPRATGPVATMPGFQMMGDAGSRFFVELTQAVPVEERHARGVITFILKGARVVRRNNENALVTVHFNTPVSRARLVPAGRDLHFVMSMRAHATPTWKINAGKEGGSVLVIDFPKGRYLP